MERKDRKAMIDGLEYTLDSDNTKLLSKLEGVKYNKDTKQYDDVPYISIEIIYQLLEQFYPGYSLESRPLEKEGTYTITKSKMNWNTKVREKVEEEVILFKKSIKLILDDGREIEGSARSVATISQISVDQTYNGFDAKCEARCIKNATKKLGCVFRIKNDREETMERESIKDDLSISDVVKNISAAQPATTPSDVKPNDVSKLDDAKKELLVKGFNEKIEKIKETKELEIKDLQNIGVELRKEHGFEKGDETDKIMITVYNEMKKEHIK